MTAMYGFGVQEYGFGLAGPATALLDAAGDKIGGVFCAPKDGNLDRIYTYCTAVAGTTPLYLARLETILGRWPTGSLLAAGSSGSVTPTAATLHTVSLTTPVAVEAGAFLATVLYSPDATGANNATFNYRSDNTRTPLTPQWGVAVGDLSAGVWSLASTLPLVVPGYDDGTLFPFCIPYYTASSAASYYVIASDHTPDEIGTRWEQVGNETCTGAVVNVRFVTADCDFTVKLYDASGDLLASLDIDVDTVSNSTSNISSCACYWDAVSLVDGATYRITVLPTSTNDLWLYYTPTLAVSHRQAISHGYKTSRTNAGAWTDDTTVAVAIVPIISARAAGGGASRAVIIGA